MVPGRMIQHSESSRSKAAKLTRRCLLGGSAALLMVTHNSTSNATSAWPTGASRSSRRSAKPGSSPGTMTFVLAPPRGLFYVRRLPEAVHPLSHAARAEALRERSSPCFICCR